MPKELEKMLLIDFTVNKTFSANNINTTIKKGYRAGTRVKSKTYIKFYEYITTLIYRNKVPKIKGNYSVFMIADEKERKDIDNIIKPIIDCLVKTDKIEDDRNMSSCQSFRFKNQKGCRIIIIPTENKHLSIDEIKQNNDLLINILNCKKHNRINNSLQVN